MHVEKMYAIESLGLY